LIEYIYIYTFVCTSKYIVMCHDILSMPDVN